MDAAHIHLLLNHVPVLGAVFGVLLLGYALLRDSEDVTRAGLWLLLVVGAASIVVYLTGEPAEELVEGLPGVSEAILESHEEAALWATVAAGAVGLVAAWGLYLYRAAAVPRRFRTVLLVLALALTGVMGWTANLGGQVRHTEIRGDTPAAGEGAVEDADGARDAGERGGKEKEDEGGSGEDAARPVTSSRRLASAPAR